MNNKKGILLIVVTALLVTACGSNLSSPQKEKIAVLDMAKLVTQHPDAKKLQIGEGILRDLITKRKNQAQMARVQLSSLAKLQQLKGSSEQSYMAADINTRMVEQRARANAELQERAKVAEQEADGLIAERKRAIEDGYQLEIFNLRLQLENVSMRGAERQALEAKLEATKREKDQKLAQLYQEKQFYVKNKLAPFMDETKQKLQAFEKQQQEEMALKLAQSQEKYDLMLKDAPDALSKALAIMDREINKQQEKNDELKAKINSDIESAAVKLAHERGYTIVFNKFEANVKAEDISGDVLKTLEQQKKD